MDVKRLGIGILFASFVIAGLAVLVSGDASARIGALYVLALFGGGGAAWFVVTARQASRRPALRIGRLTVAGASVPAFIAPYDRTILLASGLGSLAMGGGMLLLLLPGGEAVVDGPMRPVLGAGGGLLFVGVGAYALLRVRHGSLVALTREVVVIRNPVGDLVVPWRMVTRAHAFDVNGARFLGLRVADPEAIGTTTVSRLAIAGDRAVSGADASIPLGALAADPRFVIAAVERYVGNPAARSAIGTADELAAVAAMVPPDIRTPDQNGGPRVPRRRYAAASALGLLGAFWLLVTVVTVLDGSLSGSRVAGAVLTGTVATTTLVGAVLVVRRHAAGRWVGSLGALLFLALGILAVVGDRDGDASALPFLLSAVLATAVVAWGLWSGSGHRGPVHARQR